LDAELSQTANETSYRISQLEAVITSVPSPMRAEFSDALSRLESSGKTAREALDRRGTVNVDEFDSVRDVITQLKSAISLLDSTLKMAEKDVLPIVESAREEAASALADVQTRLSSQSEKIKTWFGAETCSKIAGQIEATQRDFSGGDLRKSLARSNAICANLQSLEEQAEERDSLHEKRLYVIQGLWKVVSDMGYQVQKPVLEIEGDLNSRIIMKVDTVSKGEVTFFLTLRELESDSCISEKFCLSDFDKISESLDQQFGVLTRFRVPRDSSGPVRVDAEAKPEPTAENYELEQ
jgi:hypothetical protein